MHDKLAELIAKLPVVYQPIYVGDECIADGVRPNARDRLGAICSELDGDDLVLADIGSNSGYFAIQLAKKYPNSVVLSIEPDPLYAAVQREVLSIERINNVVLVNAPLTIEWLSAAAQSCVYFDCVVLMSVLHHMPNASEILSKIWEISRGVIMEIPDPSGDGCGKDIIREQLSFQRLSAVVPLLRSLDYKYEPLPGDLSKYTHAIRYWYAAKRDLYNRSAKFPNINAIDHTDDPAYDFLQAGKYVIEFDNSWRISCFNHHKSAKIIEAVPGILFDDVAKLGQIWWPDRVDLSISAISQVDNLRDIGYQVYDVGMHNALLTPQLLRLIDYLGGGAPHDRYPDLWCLLAAINKHTYYS